MDTRAIVPLSPPTTEILEPCMFFAQFELHFRILVCLYLMEIKVKITHVIVRYYSTYYLIIYVQVKNWFLNNISDFDSRKVSHCVFTLYVNRWYRN